MVRGSNGDRATRLCARARWVDAIWAPAMIRAWKRLGLLMARVTTPLLMTVLFVAVFAPIAIALRLLRRRPLRDAHRGDATSYWITLARHDQRLVDFKRPF